MFLQYIPYITVIAVFLLILFAFHRFRWRRTKVEVGTLPEKVLEQLYKISQNLERDRSPHFEKKAYAYYKRLKVTLVVYMKENYGLTIRDRITDSQQQTAIEHFPNCKQEIFLLQKYFAELNNIKDEKNISKKKLRRLLSDVESLFEKKTSQQI